MLPILMSQHRRQNTRPQVRTLTGPTFWKKVFFILEARSTPLSALVCLIVHLIVLAFDDAKLFISSLERYIVRVKSCGTFHYAKT